MTIQGPKPEVEQSLREWAEAEQTHPRPIDELIAAYITFGDHDEWTVQTARQVLEEDAEFFQMLGDR